MAVSFEELTGSPRVRITDGKFSATRRFKIAWSDTIAFTGELLGYYSTDGGGSWTYTPPVAFPGVSQAIANDVDIAPFPEDGISTPASTSLATNTNQPPYAIVTATYTIKDYAQNAAPRQNTPEYPDGTFLTINQTVGGEFLTVPGRAFKWDGTDEQLPADVNPGIFVPSEQITLVWERVPERRIPFAEIRKQCGRVNENSFAGYSAGTVLFLGAQFNRQFQISGDVLTTVQYSFSVTARQPTDTSDEDPKGWNYSYKEKASADEHWVKIVSVDDGATPYREDGDFDSLLRFA